MLEWQRTKERPGMWELEESGYGCDEEFANYVQCDGK